MFKKKNLKKLGQILCLVLVIALGAAIVAGVTVAVRSQTETLSWSIFSLGSLDENGEYTPSEQSLYTKEAFKCVGLRIEPDFEAQFTYDVYYYDYAGNFLEAVKGLDSVYDEDHPLAKMARVVIHPEVPEDVNEKDFKINFWETYGYASMLKIIVDKKQNYLYDGCDNLYDESLCTVNMTYVSDNVGDVLELKESEYMKVSDEIAVSGEYEYYDFFIRRPSQTDIFTVGVICSSEDDLILAKDSADLTYIPAEQWVKMTIKVPAYEGELYLRVRLPLDAECYIFGYND